MAVAHSIFNMNGLQLGFGPFQISDSSVAAIWFFTLIYVLIIGAPMMIAVIFRKDTKLCDT
jgi:hypothetical protein